MCLAIIQLLGQKAFLPRGKQRGIRCRDLAIFQAAHAEDDALRDRPRF